jgi:hypothetical protein
MTTLVQNFDPNTITRLNSRLLPVLRDRVARMGDTESGAYNFYIQRLNRENLIAGYEVEIVKRFLDLGMCGGGVHEIGPGIGQLPFLFAYNGVDAVGIEIDKRRFATAAAMLDALDSAEPDVAQRVRLFEGGFPLPEGRLAPGNAVVLATNLVFTTTQDMKLKIVRAMQRYKTAIIDADRLFDRYNSAQERDGTFKLMAEAGYGPGQPFLDLGESGRYYLYTQPG